MLTGTPRRASSFMSIWSINLNADWISNAPFGDKKEAGSLSAGHTRAAMVYCMSREPRLGSVCCWLMLLLMQECLRSPARSSLLSPQIVVWSRGIKAHPLEAEHGPRPRTAPTLPGTRRLSRHLLQTKTPQSVIRGIKNISFALGSRCKMLEGKECSFVSASCMALLSRTVEGWKFIGVRFFFFYSCLQ